MGFPHFTKENAKQYSLQGQATVRARKDALEKENAKQKAIIETARALNAMQDDYPVERIVRVRAQIKRIDAMLMEELNPQAIDRLASAIAKLGEQERILSGRPLPGSQRPRLAKSPKVNGSAVEPE